MENTARVTMVRKFSLLYLLFCATPCLVLPRALHVDAVDIFLSSIYIGFQGKYFFSLLLCYHVSYVALLCFVRVFAFGVSDGEFFFVYLCVFFLAV